MSESINHHYVSQVLSKKFMSGEGKIFKYNKHHKYNSFKEKTTTKSLFSQNHLNSQKDDSGKIDNNTIEGILNTNFETNFDNHYKVILKSINSNPKIGKVLANSEELLESIDYLIGMALIGEARHPKHIEERNNVIWGAFLEIAGLSTEELRNEILSSYNNNSGFINKTIIDFAKLRNGIKKLMGDIVYSVHIAPEDDYYLLPDCTSVIKRFRSEDDVIDGKVYYNLSEPIGMVWMPINSKVLITATSSRLIPKELKKYRHGIYNIESNLVLQYNKAIFESSYSEVVCENEEYLRMFIKNYS